MQKLNDLFLQQSLKTFRQRRCHRDGPVVFRVTRIMFLQQKSKKCGFKDVGETFSLIKLIDFAKCPTIPFFKACGDILESRIGF